MRISYIIFIESLIGSFDHGSYGSGREEATIPGLIPVSRNQNPELGVRHQLPAVDDMGGCQNYGPLLGPLNTRCRMILGTQKGPYF